MKTEIQNLANTLQEELLLDLKVMDVDCQGNRDGCKVNIKQKRKYTYIDVDTCGRYMVDKEGHVWSIAAYGQKNHFLGTIQDVTKMLQENIEQMTQYKAQKVMCLNRV